MVASNAPPRICPGCRRRVVGKCATCDAARPAAKQKPKAKDPTYGLRERNRRSDTVAAWVAMHGWVCPGWQRPEHPAEELAADHIIARRLGGPQDGPLQVLCKSCNSAKGANLPTPIVAGLAVILVCGPPCGGKNRYVREHAGSGDLIVDYDALAVALQLGAKSHQHRDAHRPFIAEARDAILDRAMMGNHGVRRIWAIHGGAKRIDRDHYRRRYGAHVVLIHSPEDVCLARAQGQRPGDWTRYIRRWFSQYEADERDEVVRGHG
jgi:HNH endonuclease